MKRCNRCGEDKPVGEYRWRNKAKGYRRPYCIPCDRERGREIDKTPGRRAQRARWMDGLRERAYAALGGRVCVCCGETEPRFLTFDHIHGRDTVRSEHQHGPGQWAHVLREPHLFQVLCFNCNCGRALNGGVCPHQVGVVASSA